MWKFILIAQISFGVETIKVWEQEKSDVQALLDQAFRQFEAKNPEIKVKRSHFRTEDLRTQYQTASLASNAPEVLLAPNDFAGPLSAMQAIAEIKDVAKFDPSVVQAITDPQGRVWGTPWVKGNHLLLFVNLSLIPKTPGTLTELVEMGRTFKAANEKKYALVYNLNEPFWFVSFMMAFAEAPLKGNEPQLAQSGTADALQFVRDLKIKEKLVPSDCDYGCAESLFMDGKAGMIINGDWSISKYKGKWKENLAIAPLPKNADGQKAMRPMISGKYLMTPSKVSSAKMAITKKLIDFLTSKEQQEFFARKGGLLPSVSDALNGNTVAQDPLLRSALNGMNAGLPMPMVVEMRAVWDAIRPQLQAVMADRIDAKTAAAAMQKDAEHRIKAMRL